MSRHCSSVVECHSFHDTEADRAHIATVPETQSSVHLPDFDMCHGSDQLCLSTQSLRSDLLFLTPFLKK